MRENGENMEWNCKLKGDACKIKWIQNSNIMRDSFSFPLQRIRLWVGGPLILHIRKAKQTLELLSEPETLENIYEFVEICPHPKKWRKQLMCVRYHSEDRYQKQINSHGKLVWEKLVRQMVKEE